MMELLTGENLIALLTLTTLEVVLGIDNLVVIAILTAKLAPEQRARARRIGLLAAMGMRIGLLLTLSWMMTLTGELFRVADKGFSGRDLILLVGGLFLIAKATKEIHTKLEGPEEHPQADKRIHASMASVIAQIMAFDLVFSIDSVITAIGMARAIWVMVTAIVIAVGTMLVFANPVGDFV